ncbi:hypothetical protein SKAU_G00258320 [Synaphobranchus kaupii]|uniref:Uncharacterized protein n=1 Tax=Synaphobranchus kaupii TaxID=118154 RepID=A0A9Q1F4M9_SYNKA|nr:hypothetical protein SKAU_G00258320 [Synaphobranchus kaupii]
MWSRAARRDPAYRAMEKQRKRPAPPPSRPHPGAGLLLSSGGRGVRLWPLLLKEGSLARLHAKRPDSALNPSLPQERFAPPAVHAARRPHARPPAPPHTLPSSCFRPPPRSRKRSTLSAAGASPFLIGPADIVSWMNCRGQCCSAIILYLWRSFMAEPQLSDYKSEIVFLLVADCSVMGSLLSDEFRCTDSVINEPGIRG